MQDEAGLTDAGIPQTLIGALLFPRLDPTGFTLGQVAAHGKGGIWQVERFAVIGLFGGLLRHGVSISISGLLSGLVANNNARSSRERGNQRLALHSVTRVKRHARPHSLVRCLQSALRDHRIFAHRVVCAINPRQ